MTGFPRPELLATTDWLAGELGRRDVRIVDCRWRPDGSGAQVHAAGHIPGAVHLDWSADLPAGLPVTRQNWRLSSSVLRVLDEVGQSGVWLVTPVGCDWRNG